MSLMDIEFNRKSQNQEMRLQAITCSFLVLLCSANCIHAQQGFLNIACGSTSHFTDKRGLSWIPDTKYIKAGQTHPVSQNLSDGFDYLQNLRKFPKPLNKSCYEIPVSSAQRYLLRLWFINQMIRNNHMNWPGPFKYSVETTDMLYESERLDGSSYEYEQVLMTKARIVHVCLSRISEVDPFISAIQVIELKHGIYQWAQPGIIMVLKLFYRIDLGGDMNGSIRYPIDDFDRIWYPGQYSNLPTFATGAKISANSTSDHPPSAVMQTAQLFNNSGNIYFENGGLTRSTLFLLYFYIIDRATESVSFSVAVDEKPLTDNLSLLSNHSTSEISVQTECENGECVLSLEPTDGNGLIPLNAFEVYTLMPTKQSTPNAEVEVLRELGRTFKLNFTSWVSDPCFLVPWESINCTNMTISHLYLSGKNLSGRVPQSISRLNVLTFLDLSNNQLDGPLPDLSRLTALQTLNLENNKLNGTLPAWLSHLKNLEELSIANNNFSGEITPRLAALGPKFNFSGNQNFIANSIGNEKHNSRGHLNVILAATAAAILLVILTLTSIMHFGWRRYKERKTKGKKSSLKVKIPKSSKCRSFTMKEIISVTQDFSHEIGRGGFGPVFYGKFPDGQEVAIKVLSAFSNQGTDEFLNEIILLSGLSHENIVKLLGYCDDSGELMLIYEYMPNGSLKDYLYDRQIKWVDGDIYKHRYGKKCHLELPWKDRLQITLHAARGLLYLHMERSPRIFHRDLKSANILIDKNLNGKLSDLGISRGIVDFVSHITTTVKGTLGYLDPQYYMTRMFTDKSDIYSFGVVLLEIVCGRPPIDASLSAEHINLVSWVTSCLDTEDPEHVQLSSIIDSRLKANFASINSIAMVTGLALKCVSAEAPVRPSIKEVTEILSEALAVEENALVETGISGSSAPPGLHLSINISAHCGTCSFEPLPWESSSVENITCNL